MSTRLLTLLCLSSSCAALAADGAPRAFPQARVPARFEPKKAEPKPVVKKDAPRPPEAAAPAAAAVPAPVAPQGLAEAADIRPIVRELVAGNDRFQAGVQKHRDMVGLMHQLEKGQAPKAIVLGCSDSQVPPELLFDASLGELFVVRSAGNVADKLGVASIEYAAEHLRASVLVVLGHETCGAVTAAASGVKMPTENLQALVDEISPGLAPLKQQVRGEALVHRGVEANVHAVAYELIERSPIIRGLVEVGKLRILKAVYALDTGKVRFVGEDEGTVASLCAQPKEEGVTALAR